MCTSDTKKVSLSCEFYYGHENAHYDWWNNYIYHRNIFVHKKSEILVDKHEIVGCAGPSCWRDESTCYETSYVVDQTIAKGSPLKPLSVDRNT